MSRSARSSTTVAPSPSPTPPHHHADDPKSRTDSKSQRAFLSQHPAGSIFPYAIGANQERYHLTSSHLRKERKTLVITFFRTLLVFAVLMWAILSIFWGSCYQLLAFFNNLTVRLYDFDTPTSLSLGFSPLVGPAFISLAQSSNSMPPTSPHLGFEIMDTSTGSPSSYPSDYPYPYGTQSAISDVLTKKCWAAIVVHGNATYAWRQAVESGDGSYDPNGAVGIYFMGARFYQIVLLYLRPYLMRDTSMATTTASQLALSTILSSLSSSYTPPSEYPASTTPLTTTTTLANLQAVPQAIANPFGSYTYDLRPQTAWGAAAVFEAANIYYLIFAFHLALWHYLGRSSSGLQQKLKLRSLIILRILVPMFFYFWMSLWYTCIIAAFQVPFTNTLGRAGFIVDWALNYVALAALGLAFETMLSILTAQFLPLFLIVWIILNITSSFTPLELTGRFYNFFVIFPFYHHVEASKIIFFITAPASFLGVHFGALFGCIGVNLIGLTFAVWFERWREERSARKEKEKNRGEEEKKGENDRGEEGDR